MTADSTLLAWWVQLLRIRGYTCASHPAILVAEPNRWYLKMGESMWDVLKGQQSATIEGAIYHTAVYIVFQVAH